MLTSIDRDGTKLGPDLELVENVINKLEIPLIVGGGISSSDDIIKLVNIGVNAVSISNIIHFNKINIIDIKEELIKNKIDTRIVKI